MSKTNASFFSNFLWRFAERCGAQVVSFIVSIVLARLLAPEVYGTIALVMVFTAVLEVFIDSGFGSALIQKKDADDLDFSSVFYFNLVMCVLLYGVMFALAPTIASFYSNLSLIPIIRVLSLTLILSGIKNVQQAYVSRQMIFKKFFFATLGGTIISAALGIAMAYMGFGIWALVAQRLCNTTIDTVILWITVKWRPIAAFSWQRLKGLLSFGWKLLASGLIETIYNNLRSLVIGKIYTAEDLAFYNQGDKFPNLIISNINSSIDSVLLPTMSSVQDDCEAVRGMTRRAIKTSTYIMAPLMMGLVFCGSTVVSLVLTEKWLPCVPYMQIFCFTYMFWPVHTCNLNAIKAMGRSDLFLKLEIIKKIVGMCLLLISMKISVMAMAYSLIVSSISSQIINSWPNKKLLNYSYLSQLKDILPGILLAVVMGVCISFVPSLGLGKITTLVIQVPLGAAIYIALSAIFKLDSFIYLQGIIVSMLKR